MSDAMSGVEPRALNTLEMDAPAQRTSSSQTPSKRSLIAVIVYLALLLDNVLLTVIVPILPDYLVAINNRSRLSSLDGSLGHVGQMNVGLGLVGTLSATDHNSAYSRYVDGSPSMTQAVITKHPIPGKSMVNFSLLHTDNKVSQGPLAESPQQQPPQPQISPSNIISGKTENSSNTTLPRTSSNEEATEKRADSLENENGSIGILLSTKALVQLICNPIVGNLSNKYGYRLPIVVGTFFLLVSSLVFSIADTYFALIVARSVQGIGSACIGVCGMSLVAQHYPEAERRSKVMGIVLGSIALGVLLGYPFGSILYDLIGKSAPFIILSTIIFLSLVMQLFTMDLSVQTEAVIDVEEEQKPQWRPLLENRMILAIVVAIWFSTSTMAILEPCLPIWLIQYLKPTKWQLGTVFIPDSLGYFVGTNFFGSLAYTYGQVRVSCASLLLVGFSSVLIPSATTVTHLLLPHFGLGLGIGIIDAALVPLLATFVDAILVADEQNELETGPSEHSGTISSYGTVYAIQQTSVSLAYFLAPLIGGELAQAFGFPWLMRIVGFFNMLYGPLLVIIYQKYDPKNQKQKNNAMLLTNTGRGSKYRQLYNSMDIE